MLLGGPPGSGKSTIAETFASTAERPTVHLQGFILPYLPAAKHQNEVVQTSGSRDVQVHDARAHIQVITTEGATPT
ncbi:AAA family ATPase [Nonomuraea sp. NPDC050451]|uniref:AAA family ATPase n=1 Tax=Nonomuraea sp. NPDC050451 TaxID=3364364 RepID=UPI003788D7B5